ncbi:long chain acyl-CoA synthetase [Trifolium repens]|nr:long chain acyl-CoA synthetase [Trifolium repens]
MGGSIYSFRNGPQQGIAKSSCCDVKIQFNFITDHVHSLQEKRFVYTLSLYFDSQETKSIAPPFSAFHRRRSSTRHRHSYSSTQVYCSWSKEVYDASIQMGSAMKSHGVNHVSCVYGANCPEWIIAMEGLLILKLHLKRYESLLGVFLFLCPDATCLTESIVETLLKM